MVTQIALPRPSLYTDGFVFLSSCGTMFPHVSSVQDTWRHRGFQRRSRGVNCVDMSPPDQDQDTCAKYRLGDRDQRVHRSTRGCNGSVRSSLDKRIKTTDRRLTRRRVEASGASDLHRTTQSSFEVD